MQDLLFALNSTMPIFFTMAAGMLFRRLGWIDESFASQMNRFVFRVVLPINLFVNLYPVDFFAVWDTRFVLYCFLATAASIGVALFIARLVIPPIFAASSCRRLTARPLPCSGWRLYRTCTQTAPWAGS